jgi:hypothetical protein
MSGLTHRTRTIKGARLAFVSALRNVTAPAAGIISRCLSFAVIGVLLSAGLATALAQNEDPKDLILKKLNEQFVLTKMTADGMDVVTAGSTVTLRREGLQMCSVQAKIPMPNVYRDGKLSAGKFAWAMALGLSQPSLPSSQVPVRNFVTDEKFWVTAIGVEKNEVVFKVYSDVYQDVRYYAQLGFPYNKKSVPSADDMLKTIAEVITAEPPSASQGPVAPAPTEPAMAPIAPPPPPADESPLPAAGAPPVSPTSAAAQPPTISLGDSKSKVIAAFGQPQKVVKLPPKEIDYYQDMKVTYVNGKVSAVD